MISVDNVKVSVTKRTYQRNTYWRNVWFWTIPSWCPSSLDDRQTDDIRYFSSRLMRLTIFERSWRRRSSLKRGMNASSVSRNEASHRERSSEKSWCVHFATVAYDLRMRCIVLQYLDEYQWKLWDDTKLSTRGHLNNNVRQVVSGLYSILKRNVHDDTYALTGTWSWVDSAQRSVNNTKDSLYRRDDDFVKHTFP